MNNVQIISIDPAKSSGIAYLSDDKVIATSVKYTGFGGYMDQSIFIFNEAYHFHREIPGDRALDRWVVIENLEAFSPQQREMVGYLLIKFHEMDFKVVSYTPKDWKQVHDYYGIEIDEDEFEYWEQFLKPNDKKDYDRKLTKMKSLKLVVTRFELQCDDDDAADALCIAQFHRLVLEGKLTSQKGAGKRRRAEINERKKQRARASKKYAIWNKCEKAFLTADGGFTRYKTKILYVGLDTISNKLLHLDSKDYVRVPKDKVEEKLKGI